MNQDMTKSVKLFWIGILTCLSFVLFFYGIKYLQNESFQQSTLSFKVVFKNSQGIDSGDEVRMLGKKIGYVKSTNIIGQNIILDISVGDMFKNSIPVDSRFEITSGDLMGGKHLTIYPGKDTNKFVLNGDTISGKNSEMVSLTQDIGDFARTLNETFGADQKSQVIDAINSFNKFTKDLELFLSENKDIITNEDKENLHLILSNTKKVSGSFQLLIEEQSDNISMAIENISDFTVDLPNISAQISKLSLKVENMVDNINTGDGTLSKLIEDDQLYTNMITLVENTNGLITEARVLTKDVQDNPKKYIRAYFAAKREDSKNK
tara:strand:- start:19516 stop:20478 length:963 start_codon:yes stop_codon:yes gene_type:complete